MGAFVRLMGVDELLDVGFGALDDSQEVGDVGRRGDGCSDEYTQPEAGAGNAVVDLGVLRRVVSRIIRIVLLVEEEEGLR